MRPQLGASILPPAAVHALVAWWRGFGVAILSAAGLLIVEIVALLIDRIWASIVLAVRFQRELAPRKIFSSAVANLSSIRLCPQGR